MLIVHYHVLSGSDGVVSSSGCQVVKSSGMSGLHSYDLNDRTTSCCGAGSILGMIWIEAIHHKNVLLPFHGLHS